MKNATPDLPLPPQGQTHLRALLEHHFPHTHAPLVFTELPQYIPTIQEIIKQNYVTPETLEILEIVMNTANNHILLLVGILLSGMTFPEAEKYLTPLLHTEVIRLGIQQIIKDTLGNTAQA